MLWLTPGPGSQAVLQFRTQQFQWFLNGYSECYLGRSEQGQDLGIRTGVEGLRALMIPMYNVLVYQVMVCQCTRSWCTSTMCWYTRCQCSRLQYQVLVTGPIDKINGVPCAGELDVCHCTRCEWTRYLCTSQ